MPACANLGVDVARSSAWTPEDWWGPTLWIRSIMGHRFRYRLTPGRIRSLDASLARTAAALAAAVATVPPLNASRLITVGHDLGSLPPPTVPQRPHAGAKEVFL